MAQLTILRGVSGSGKSTYAKTQDAIIVSRDSIRILLFGSESMENEELVTRVEHTMIREALRAGKDVVSDNTNIVWKFVRNIAELGFAEDADVNIKVFDLSLQECLLRNRMRADSGGRFVPENVIKKQYERFRQTKGFALDHVNVVAYNGTPGKPRAFLVDLDGTLAHMNRGAFEWFRVGEDEIDVIVSGVVKSLSATNDYGTVVMSGRDSVCREDTQEWLEKHNVPYDHLFMRAKDDMRPDTIVKHELFNECVRENFDVQFVIDDRPSVCRMWRKMGLTVFQVGDPSVEF